MPGEEGKADPKGAASSNPVIVPINISCGPRSNQTKPAAPPANPVGKEEFSRGTTPIHEFPGTFKGERVRYRVSSVTGHVFSIDFTGPFRSWDCDPDTLFGAGTVKESANGKQRMEAHLKSVCRGCSDLVLMLDNDREGHNICFEVLDTVCPSLGWSQTDRRIHRALFSAVTPQAIQDAMSHLTVPDKDASDAVEARQEIDLKIGVAWTRFLTRYFQGKYANLDTHLVSYGPCQTPTLGFCVKRHDDIQSFKPRPFWTVRLGVPFPASGSVSDPKSIAAARQNSHSRFTATHKSMKRGEADAIKAALESSSRVVVESVSMQDATLQRPLGLNTVDMLKQASAKLCLSPQETMHLAERLYLSGYLSYPRTESTAYPGDYNLRGMVETLSPVFPTSAQTVLNGPLRPRPGKDVGDHPPIIPVRVCTQALAGEGWSLYSLVAKNFLASLATDCKLKKTSVTLSAGGTEFCASGSIVVDPGFASITDAIPSTNRLPAMRKGEVTEAVDVGMTEGQTQPPGHLSESDLLTKMETHAIGTDSSMATHVGNIISRNFVRLDPQSRRLRPTPLGVILIHGYQAIDRDLVAPTLRSTIEAQINRVATGELTRSQLVSETLSHFHQRFRRFVGSVSLMDALFEVSFDPIASAGRVFSRCGDCHRYMRFIGHKPQRLHCATCDRTHSLPQGGKTSVVAP
ncbi:DNA topoisomerase, type IA [Kipferlia bialata]|uniref:DNA topoisomerase n=1 Tax=Kipferlia bialata TaxID=797122 RepID=A0A9K3GES5_9EUKA|nr:DNA topoisomerase, type IA [Kipferlia bialata]|eukprot:g2202.t1